MPDLADEEKRGGLLGFLINHGAWWLLFTAVFAVIAAFLSTDGTPDFKIYHFYNGFAAHHDRSALDIFPAQLQTALFPGVDAVYFSIFTALNDHPILLNVLLSLPYSIAAFVAFLIGRLFVAADFYGRNVACAGAAILGLTGASALPTLATTMSEIVPGVPVLIALAAWLYFERAERNNVWTALAVGCLAGFSVGLKLTLAPLFVAMFLAIAVRRALGRPSAFWQAFAFGLAGVVVFALLDGSWLWGNWQAYGNPIFPLMNQIFDSDLVDHSPWRDLRFMPKTTLMALFYPAYWAFRSSHHAIELDMRDPRILIGCVSAVIVLIAFAVRRLRDGPAAKSVEVVGLCLAIVFLASYALWEDAWSIYRYLAIQECLSGVMALIALTTILGSRLKSAWVFALFALVVVATMATTRYPWWSRAQRGPQAISVVLPPIEPNAMVVFLDPYAYSYLVPFMPDTARAIGANTNLVRPGSPGLLEPQIESTIRDHQGPLWGMEYPEVFPGVADSTLASHHLTREDDCALVDTNMEEKPFVRICRLKRK